MELIRALGFLAEAPAPATGGVAAALGLPSPRLDEYTEVFVMQLYPYASVYLGSEGMIGGDAGERIAGFWRALLLEPPAEPDHLTALLGLYASLGDQEELLPEASARRVLLREARKALLWEHLLCWLPRYLDHVEKVGAPSYSRWAGILRDVLAAEAARLGPPAAAPQHHTLASGLADPRQSAGDAFLTSLLAPARSGLILVRADLARAARELGLGLRFAERSYSLRSLLGQNPEGTLRWLAAEASHAAAAARSSDAVFAPALGHWRTRASATAALLSDLGAEAMVHG